MKWTAYKTKDARKCEDCMQVAYEASREGRSAPLARGARFRLDQGGKLIALVCAEHKQLRDNPGA